jgi:uncharacterized membrane protein YdjX (TVP38/TMEM64 family)
MTRKKKILIGVIIGAVVFLAFLIYFQDHTPPIIKYIEDGNVAALTKYIRSAGRTGKIVLILLQILETLAIFLPALPVYICAGIMYGKLEGIVMCYITNLIINAGMFMFARMTKETIAAKVNKSKNMKRIDMLKKKIKKPDLIVLIISLIPIVPNGMIPYISAQMDINILQYMRALAVGCLPAIVVIVVCGDVLLRVPWDKLILLLIFVGILVALFFVFKKRINKWIESKMS